MLYIIKIPIFKLINLLLHLLIILLMFNLAHESFFQKYNSMK